MPALWLAQLLCPERHAICALAYDINQTPKAEIDEHLVRAGELFGPEGCGLCGSRELHVEHGKLPTDDWTEAWVVLKAQEAANLQTREFFHRSKGSVN